MKTIDRLLVATLTAGIWALIALQVASHPTTYAQETTEAQPLQEPAVAPRGRDSVNATEIVGLRAQIEQVVRQHQFRPQSISGLDQFVRSVVRNCRVNGGTTGGRISNASISC